MPSTSTEDWASATLTAFSLADLTEGEAPDWQAVEAALAAQPALFERTLFGLHYKRRKPFDAGQRRRILTFLSTAYRLTGDVRYFNEFLWFCPEGAEGSALRQACQAQFEANLDGGRRHRFPLATPAEARAFLEQHRLSAEPPFDPSLKVGLVGFPPFFPKIIDGLQREGYNVAQYFIPHHPNKHVKRLLSNGLLVKCVSLLKRNRHRYETLRHAHNAPETGAALNAAGFDLGFHKLNCIIRKNIIGAFRLGLVNDHWGMLPYLRGKSTIAYTLLFGFPMAATLHVVDEGIDTGALVGFADYDIRGLRTIGAVRNRLRATLADRAVRALKQLSAPGFTPLPNEQSKGLTFYEIHPWLSRFIEREILSQD